MQTKWREGKGETVSLVMQAKSSGSRQGPPANKRQVLERPARAPIW